MLSAKYTSECRDDTDPTITETSIQVTNPRYESRFPEFLLLSLQAAFSYVLVLIKFLVGKLYGYNLCVSGDQLVSVLYANLSTSSFAIAIIDLYTCMIRLDHDHNQCNLGQATLT